MSCGPFGPGPTPPSGDSGSAGMPLSIPEASPVGEWTLLPDQLSAQPVPPRVAVQPVALEPAERPQEWALLPDQGPPAPAALVLVPQLLQPVALEPTERPQEWALLPTISSIDPLEMVQTYSPASTNANVQPFAGVAPNGVLRLSLVVTPGPTMVRFLACCLAQIGGAGNIAMAIYDRTGVLLGSTGQVAVPGVADILVIPLPSPVSLVGGRRFYLALWTSSNGTGFFGQTGIFNGAGPTISCELPNTTFPLPAGPISLSNKIQQTLYVAGLEQATP